MTSIDGLLSQIEEAIRLDFAAKISALEEERDAKIERVRAALGDENTPLPPPKKRSIPAQKPRPAARPARKEAEASPSGKPSSSLSNESRQMLESILRREGEFTSSEVQEEFPGVSYQLLAYHLRNLVKRGEIRLLSQGKFGKPSRFGPMPLNSLRRNGSARGNAASSAS